MGKGNSGALVLLLLLVVVGGLSALMLLHPRFSYLDPLPETGTLSPAIDIDVYVDGSGSMKDFLLAGGNGNTFHDLLTICEDALKSGVTQGGWDLNKRTVRFWKFGPKSGPQRLDSGGASNAGVLRAMAGDPSLFDAPTTPIESAVDAQPPVASPGASELMIVITDLYQSDGKLERPAFVLGQRFLSSENGAVAIYGVRNPYKGGVDDLPGQGDEKLPDAATTMPFYIIIAGNNAADVRQAQKLLTTGDSGHPLHDANTAGRLFAAYFSRSAGRYSRDEVVYDEHVFKNAKDRLLHFSDQPNPHPTPGEEGSAETVGKSRHGLSARVTGFQLDHLDNIAEIEIANRPLKENLVGVSWIPDQTAQQGQAAYEEPLWETKGAETAKATEWQVRAFYCPVPNTTATGPCPKSPKQPLKLDVRAARGIHVCNPILGTGTVDICQADGEPRPSLSVLIDRHFLTRGRKYLLEFDEVSTADSQTVNFLSGSDLMNDWNMTPAEVRDLLAKPEQQRKFAPIPADHLDQHPGKTPNLAQFLSALDGFVMSSGSGAGDTTVRLQTYFLYLNAR